MRRPVRGLVELVVAMEYALFQIVELLEHIGANVQALSRSAQVNDGAGGRLSIGRCNGERSSATKEMLSRKQR